MYYKDPLNDDFSGTKIKHGVLDETYDFVPKNFFYRMASHILRAIAFPIIFLIEHVYLGINIRNRKALKGLKGAYLYGNHTGWYDAFTPMLLAFPHQNKIIANPDAVSIKGLKTIVKMLGTIPLATNTAGMVRCIKDVDYCHRRGEYITVYPEAHIWPYYTGVRPFEATSFRYPVKDGAPVVVFFTAFSKPEGMTALYRKVRMTVYVSDPMYPDMSLAPKEAQKELRNRVYDFMQTCSQKYSTYGIVDYVNVAEMPLSAEDDEAVPVGFSS